MKRLLPFVALLLFFPISVQSWGFFAHRTINYAAVFTLPEEMFSFYRIHAETLRSLAVNPDKRRYVSEVEAPRHYLDADFYESRVPLDTLPKHWDSAVARYGIDTIRNHGIVPWHVIRIKYQLTRAFMTHDYKKIISISADLGHYIGDLHVPLHATHNYNGQLTNQKGIHGFWESRLPELFSNQYDLFLGRARYILNVPEEVWLRFEQSFAAKDSVLLFEAKLDSNTKPDKKYGFEDRGNQVVKTYSESYSRKYHNTLNNMVERRLRSSIEFVGSMWYTAWVDAGQPILDESIHFDLTEPSLDSSYQHSSPKGRLEGE